MRLSDQRLMTPASGFAARLPDRRTRAGHLVPRGSDRACDNQPRKPRRHGQDQRNRHRARSLCGLCRWRPVRRNMIGQTPGGRLQRLCGQHQGHQTGADRPMAQMRPPPDRGQPVCGGGGDRLCGLKGRVSPTSAASPEVAGLGQVRCRVARACREVQQAQDGVEQTLMAGRPPCAGRPRRYSWRTGMPGPAISPSGPRSVPREPCSAGRRADGDRSRPRIRRGPKH